MAEIRQIVDRLNDAPFRMGMSLVVFDGKTPMELLQILNDVVAYLDSRHKRDVRDEGEATAHRITAFLHALKYPLPRSDIDMFKERMAAAETSVVYPVLRWLLADLEKHRKRAYVARFLTPVPVPPEFLQDDAIMEGMEQLRVLQEQFKETHKTLDKLRSTNLSPADLRQEIKQLEEERQNLLEKIDELKAKTGDMPGFPALLEVTSAMRKEQEEEARLHERMEQQRIALAESEERYSEVSRRLSERRASGTDSLSAEDVLARLQREVSESRRLATVELPAQIRSREDRLRTLEEVLSAPPRTEDDVADLQARVSRAEREVDELNERISRAQREAGDSNVAKFRQQAALITRKLREREEALEEAEKENSELGRQIEDKEASLAQMRGPSFMGREEFAAYGDKLRVKTHKYKQLKMQLAAASAETVTLQRTEAILKSKVTNLEEFMSKMAAERGVEGYRDTKDRVEKVSALTATVDELKGKTLEEISKIVEEISRTLAAKKAELQPQMQSLKDARQRHAELERAYRMKRSVFENMKAGLDSQRLAVEKECTANQDAALREESRYHMLHCLSALTAAQQRRLKEEEAFQAGRGQLSSEFRTYRELFTTRLATEEALAKELRKKQRHVTEHEVDFAAQRARFQQLLRLVEAKKAAVEKARARAEEDEAAAEAGFGVEMGGANVMTIEQGK